MSLLCSLILIFVFPQVLHICFFFFSHTQEIIFGSDSSLYLFTKIINAFGFFVLLNDSIVFNFGFFLIFSGIIFSIGAFGIAFNRKNVILLMVSVEIMFLGINLIFISGYIFFKFRHNLC